MGLPLQKNTRARWELAAARIDPFDHVFLYGTPGDFLDVGDWTGPASIRSACSRWAPWATRPLDRRRGRRRIRGMASLTRAHFGRVQCLCEITPRQHWIRKEKAP